MCETRPLCSYIFPGSCGFLCSPTMHNVQLSLRTETGAAPFDGYLQHETLDGLLCSASTRLPQLFRQAPILKHNLHLLCGLLSGSAGPLPAYCSRSGLSASQNFLILAGRLSSQDPGPSREGVRPRSKL
jgi:hypothetical protein